MNQGEGRGIDMVRRCQWSAAVLGILIPLAAYVPFVFLPFYDGAHINDVFSVAKFITFICLIVGLIGALLSRLYFKVKSPVITIEHSWLDVFIYVFSIALTSSPFMSAIIWTVFDTYMKYQGG